MLIIDFIVRRRINLKLIHNRQEPDQLASLHTNTKRQEHKKKRRKKRSSDTQSAQKKRKKTVLYHSEVLFHDVRLNTFGKSKNKQRIFIIIEL
jgi:hypothetical protein